MAKTQSTRLHRFIFITLATILCLIGITVLLIFKFGFLHYPKQNIQASSTLSKPTGRALPKTSVFDSLKNPQQATNTQFDLHAIITTIDTNTLTVTDGTSTVIITPTIDTLFLTVATSSAESKPALPLSTLSLHPNDPVNLIGYIDSSGKINLAFIKKINTQ